MLNFVLSRVSSKTINRQNTLKLLSFLSVLRKVTKFEKSLNQESEFITYAKVGNTNTTKLREKYD